jgi:hypothetical protein
MTKHAPHQFFNPILPALPSGKYQPFELLILFLLEKSVERRSKGLGRLLFRHGLGLASGSTAATRRIWSFGYLTCGTRWGDALAKQSQAWTSETLTTSQLDISIPERVAKIGRLAILDALAR